MGRKYDHDYKGRCIYHITLKKTPGIPAFGNLVGIGKDASVRRSPLGNIVARQIYGMNHYHPNLKLLQYVIMPDHVHFILFVTAPLPYHLGNYISRLKVGIGQDNAAVTGVRSTVFQEDFYDCILHPGRSLDTLFNYLRDNPRRLAERRANPDYFRRANTLIIDGHKYQAYGNMQLLACPFKEQVVVHRADTAQQRELNRQQWLYTASSGGVLVLPFISPAEKSIRAETEPLGARFILVTAQPFGERYKPSLHDFTICEAGRLLIISAADSLAVTAHSTLSRANCLFLNHPAEVISAPRFNPDRGSC